MADFIDNFHTHAKLTASYYPERPQRIVNGISNAGILGSYESFHGFEKALERIDSRLSERARAKDSALNYIVPVLDNYEPLERDFVEYFPELIRFFTTHSLGDAEGELFR